MKKIICLFGFILTSCTINRNTEILHNFEVQNQKICVLKNNNLKYPGFTNILVDQLKEKGFVPTLVEKEDNCPMVLKYSAEWEFDMAYYLTDVEFDVYKKNVLLAKTQYHVTGGSWNLLIWYKYRRSITIIRDMLDELKEKLAEGKNK